MRFVSEFSLDQYEPWSGAVDTWRRIQDEGKEEELETILDGMYEDGAMTDTQLNDLLWFESDMVFDWLGLPTENSLKDAIEEKQEELDDLLSDYKDYEEDEDYTKEALEEIWREDFKDDFDELTAEIEELKTQLANL